LKTAWAIISSKQRPTKKMEKLEEKPLIVNLRNLIIFLLGIENIYNESMCC
jgi:hypothetical protein